jgi:hypothetical protein
MELFPRVIAQEGMHCFLDFATIFLTLGMNANLHCMTQSEYSNVEHTMLFQYSHIPCSASSRRASMASS